MGVRKDKMMVMRHYVPLRLDEATWERLQAVVDVETRRIGRPQPTNGIVRQCVLLGLEVLAGRLGILDKVKEK